MTAPGRGPRAGVRHVPAAPNDDVGHGLALRRVDAGTRFEDGDPAPVPLPAGAPEALRVEVGGGPSHVPAGRPGVGLTGLHALHVVLPGADGTTAGSSGPHGAGPVRRVLLDGLDVAIEAGTELRYAVCPVLDDALGYAATAVAVEARLDDGSWTGQHVLVDRYGAPASARGQGEARILLVDHWNLVRIDLSALAGRRVRAVAVTLDPPQDAIGPAEAEVWLDHVQVGLRDEPVRDGAVDHVDTRRGSHSSGAYSRGNTFPVTSVPNGFVSWTPLTDGASDRWLYSWAGHTDAANRPVLHGIAISHQPSPWMGDRNQLAVHAVAGGDVPDASLAARGRPFSHDDELARPHHYAVLLDGGAAALPGASGDGPVRLDVTPTDHGGALRFAFPPGAGTGHVLLDAVGTEGAGPDGPAALTVDGAGVVTGWVDTGSGLSVGRSRMYLVGRFSRPPAAVALPTGDRPHARSATFAVADDPVVELRIATSFIGTDQAWRTYAAELADRTFAEVEAAARAAWQDRLGVLDVEGATEEQLATLYGGLYRLNLYPSSQWEDAGDPGRPEPRHASPVAPPTGPSGPERTGAAVLPGRMMVNHGFWDTYRTCWPAYALLYPEAVGELADGFVQQYREGGWVARWSSPGYADLMTGTSADVVLADLHARGVALPDPLAAYDAGLRDATALPDGDGAGRKGQEHALLRGYVPQDVEESVSWHLENCLADGALAGMARALAADPRTPDDRRRGLADESGYLAQRAGGYRHLFDPGTGFFRARGRDGRFAAATGFDPRDWGGDYTESDAWNFAFHAAHDPVGLAELHGGPAGLAAVLDRFFAEPERADRPGGYGQVIHEMVEARDVRLGQLGQSNQVSHHIPYTWLAAGRPDRTQEVVRDILDRLWTGSEIGQGYHGDEDNGEMSAWYVLSALGLYPWQTGTDRWAVGTPLLERAVLHHPTGDLVIDAPGAGRDAPYVHGVTLTRRGVDGSAAVGRAVTEPWIAHGDLLGGVTVRFTMGAEPSGWGRVPRDPGRAAEVPEAAEVADRRSADLASPVAWPAAEPWSDLTGDPGAPYWQGRDGAVPVLSADSLAEGCDLAEVLDAEDALVWPGTDDGSGASEGTAELVACTLTSAVDGRPGPDAWRLEVRGANGEWHEVDRRSGELFRWPGQLRPFVLDAPVPLASAARGVRLVVPGRTGTIAQLELLVRAVR
ncbi:MAG TPA: GH92 family glycosyl hydrolase [Cellulomonas sp.]